MKKFFVIALFAFTSTTLTAQSRIHSNFGIKIGANAAKLGQPQINWDTRYSWHAGLLAHLHIREHFAIQPELIYSNQGAEHVIPGSDRLFKLGYLNIPVLFQYMTGSGFRFQAGPQIGFLVKADQELNGTESDIKSSIKKTDFSLLGGASYIMLSGFGFDARYIYGLTDISNTDDVSGPGADLNNLVIQVGIFYQFKHQ